MSKPKRSFSTAIATATALTGLWRPNDIREPMVLLRAEHLAEHGITVSYTNVFWGGRSEIKPSEISPIAYAKWCAEMGIDPADMRGA